MTKKCICLSKVVPEEAFAKANKEKRWLSRWVDMVRPEIRFSASRLPTCSTITGMRMQRMSILQSIPRWRYTSYPCCASSWTSSRIKYVLFGKCLASIGGVASVNSRKENRISRVQFEENECRKILKRMDLPEERCPEFLQPFVLLLSFSRGSMLRLQASWWLPSWYFSHTESARWRGILWLGPFSEQTAESLHHECWENFFVKGTAFEAAKYLLENEQFDYVLPVINADEKYFGYVRMRKGSFISTSWTFREQPKCLTFNGSWKTT